MKPSPALRSAAAVSMWTALSAAAGTVPRSLNSLMRRLICTRWIRTLRRLPMRGHVLARSAERRVGKECFSPCSARWTPYYSHKKSMTEYILLEEELFIRKKRKEQKKH